MRPALELSWNVVGEKDGAQVVLGSYPLRSLALVMLGGYDNSDGRFDAVYVARVSK